MEDFIPDCESAYLAQTRGPLAGRRVRLREARADFDGYIAELLSKAMSQAQLDQPLTAQDRERLLAYLRRLGALDQQGQYRGSTRRGFDEQGRPFPPLAIGDLLGIPDFYVQTDWWSQPTMMQVVGGMDRLPAALAARLGNRIVYRAAVREIRQNERGVWVIYAEPGWKAAACRRRLLRQHNPAAGAERHREGSLTTGAVGDCGIDVTMPPAKSACSSAADSGNRTTRFTAADRGPIRRSDKLSTPRMASTGAKVCSSATTSISAGG